MSGVVTRIPMANQAIVATTLTSAVMEVPGTEGIVWAQLELPEKAGTTRTMAVQLEISPDANNWIQHATKLVFDNGAVTSAFSTMTLVGIGGGNTPSPAPRRYTIPPATRYARLLVGNNDGGEDANGTATLFVTFASPDAVQS